MLQSEGGKLVLLFVRSLSAVPYSHSLAQPLTKFTYSTVSYVIMLQKYWLIMQDERNNCSSEMTHFEIYSLFADFACILY